MQILQLNTKANHLLQIFHASRMQFSVTQLPKDLRWRKQSRSRREQICRPGPLQGAEHINMLGSQG
jgi:hypothetical protein